MWGDTPELSGSSRDTSTVERGHHMELEDSAISGVLGGRFCSASSPLGRGILACATCTTVLL